nr:MAG TPA: hypothetical protein [Caudoviricetes sp.]
MIGEMKNKACKEEVCFIGGPPFFFSSKSFV